MQASSHNRVMTMMDESVERGQSNQSNGMIKNLLLRQMHRNSGLAINDSAMYASTQLHSQSSLGGPLISSAQLYGDTL